MNEEIVRAKAKLARACRLSEGEVLARLCPSSDYERERIEAIVREVYSVDYETTYAVALAATQAVVPYVEKLGGRAIEIMACELGKV